MGTFLSDSFLLLQGSHTTKRAKLDRSFKGSEPLWFLTPNPFIHRGIPNTSLLIDINQ